MTLRRLIRSVFRQDGLNFLLTNRIPRRTATRFMGWFSRIEQPLIRDLSIGTWRLFSELDLSDAKKSQFRSLHDCFIRELKDGARPIDDRPAILVSPCDAIIGACCAVAGTEAYQVKGLGYDLRELLCDDSSAEDYRDGCYVTLRLTATMYHRFHAPHDCRVERVTYAPGDTWNVNPPALRRVEKVFCKNERAVLRARLIATGHCISLVPVAAILVAGIRLRFLELPLRFELRGGKAATCDACFNKGEEMGWFQHGSTIIVFASRGFHLCDGVREGMIVRVGEPLMRLPGRIG